MGVTVSKTAVSGGSFAMAVGDTFLYSVEDPRGRMLSYNSNVQNLKWLQNVGINPGDEGNKHLIYEGRVTELVMRDNQLHYKYELLSLWNTPDRFKKSGTPWTWESHAKDSEHRKFYFGTATDAPKILSVPPKGSEYPTNANVNGTLVYSFGPPSAISAQDTNLGVNGEFNRLSNDEILAFLNKYAMNASFTGRTSVPEVQTAAKRYLTYSPERIKDSYLKKEKMMLNNIGQSAITVEYKTSDGMPESETVDLPTFLNTGIQVLKSNNEIRDYIGLTVDRGVDYQNIFDTEKDTIAEHRKAFGGEEAIVPNIEIKSGVIMFNGPKLDIPFVNVKDPMDTDQIMMDHGYSQISKLLENHKNIQGWTQVKETNEHNGTRVKTYFYSNVSKQDQVQHEADEVGDSGIRKTYVSGFMHGYEDLMKAGSEDAKVGKSSYFSVKYSRNPMVMGILDALENERVQILAMLYALIQNDHTIRGTAGALNMLKGGSDVPSRMFLLSEALKAHHTALMKATHVRNQIIVQEQMEGFANMEMPIGGSLAESDGLGNLGDEGFTNIREQTVINKLRTAIEQNDAVSNQIGEESTIASAKFAGAIIAAGAFFAIAFYSLKR